jgi:hypothetical protein
MTSPPFEARISRIFFVTDMTRPQAPEIPLGFMLEAVWPEQARWLGLIGRTRLNSTEIDAINLATWPEMEKPFGLLDKIFDQGWEGAWGEAGIVAQTAWTRSALIIETSKHDELPSNAQIDSDTAWSATTDMLCAQLSLLGERLVPVTVPLLPVLRPRSPFRALPRGRRMQEDFAQAV